MEIDLAFLADAATVDVSGKLNVLGIFDRLSVPEFPAGYPHISLVLRFSASMGEAGNHRVEIVLKDPDNKEMMKLDGDLQVGPGPALAGGQIRVPQVINIERLRFPKGGRYQFEVMLDGVRQVSLPLTVHGLGSVRPPAQA